MSLLVLSSTMGSHICRFIGYVVSLQARSCNEMGFPSFFNNIRFLKCWGRSSESLKDNSWNGSEWLVSSFNVVDVAMAQ